MISAISVDKTADLADEFMEETVAVNLLTS
jgi:hypothetical protein